MHFQKFPFRIQSEPHRLGMLGRHLSVNDTQQHCFYMGIQPSYNQLETSWGGSLTAKTRVCSSMHNWEHSGNGGGGGGVLIVILVFFQLLVPNDLDQQAYCCSNLKRAHLTEMTSCSDTEQAEHAYMMSWHIKLIEYISVMCRVKLCWSSK